MTETWAPQRGTDAPGRTRTRLTARLAAEGYTVGSEGILAASGGQRQSLQDWPRWTATATKDGRTVHLSSWDTMTDCARLGVVIHRHATMDTSDFLVDAKRA